MRWYWIDRFIEFESGRRVRAVKNVSLSEEHLHDHLPGFPVMPNSLIIEGCAQAGGIMVGEHRKYQGNMILAKVPKAVFHFPAVPGDTLTYTIVLEYIKDDGALVSATSHVGDRLQAELEIVFANVAEGEKARELFSPVELERMMELLGAFRVGVGAEGGSLARPGPIPVDAEE